LKLDPGLVGEAGDHSVRGHLVAIVLLVLQKGIHLVPHVISPVAEVSARVLQVDLQMDSNIECDMAPPEKHPQ